MSIFPNPPSLWMRKHRQEGEQGQTGQGLGHRVSQSLEKVTLFRSFFSTAAWTDLTTSWVCSMLMFQDV